MNQPREFGRRDTDRYSPIVRRAYAYIYVCTSTSIFGRRGDSTLQNLQQRAATPSCCPGARSRACKCIRCIPAKRGEGGGGGGGGGGQNFEAKLKRESDRKDASWLSSASL